MTWKAICDVCGFKFDASQLKLRWDGLRTCDHDFEHRHPQDFLRVRADDQSVPWTRPEPEIVYGGPVCTLKGRSAYAGIAVAGCSTTHYTPSVF